MVVSVLLVHMNQDMVECLGVSIATFASMVVAWYGVSGPLVEGEFNSSALLVVCRAVHVERFMQVWMVHLGRQTSEVYLNLSFS